MKNNLYLGSKAFDSVLEAELAFKIIEDSFLEIPNLIHYDREKNFYTIKRVGIALICLKLKEILFTDNWMKIFITNNMNKYSELYKSEDEFSNICKDALKTVSDIFFYTLCSMEICKDKKIKVFWE